MLFKYLAAFAAGTSAFLIPPEVSKSDIDTVNALPFEVAAEGADRVIDIKCPGCPVPAVNIDHTSIKVDSTLELHYKIEKHEDGADKLSLNDIPIYPPNLKSIKPFKASQKFPEDQPFDTLENVNLGYEMTMKPVAKDGAELELISVNLQIFEVADKFIDGIPDVEVKLIRTPSGKLMIADVQKLPSTSHLNDKNCSTMVCKWRAFLAAKLGHLKPYIKGKMGCAMGKGNKAGKMGGHKAGMMGGQIQGKPHHGGRPHSSEAPHREGHHRHNHGFLVRFLRNAVIPVSIGVLAGLAASVVGMIVGQLIVFAWRAIRGRQVYAPVVQDEEYPKEPPPVYKDVVVIVEEVKE